MIIYQNAKPFFVAVTNSEKKASDVPDILLQKVSHKSHAFFSDLINVT